MSQERLSMRKIREMLRLKGEAGLSNRVIARACHLSNSTVGEYLRRAVQAGLPKPDISILGEKFLEEFTWERGENLRIRLLNKLLQDEIQLRQRKNLIKYQSFKNKLDKALERYHQNALTAAEIVQIMVDIRR